MAIATIPRSEEILGSETRDEYQEFLERKRRIVPAVGFDVAEEDVHPLLFPFQRALVRWGCKRGKAAVFAGTGLGKTLIQLSWARAVHAYTGRDVLILAPLAVAQQTAREGAKIDLSVTVCRTQADVRPGVNVTNYEMLGHFEWERFVALVVDESSILKSYEGTVRRQITEFASHLPFRLACTATPAPNDLIELGTHAEFLGIITIKEMAALYFRQDKQNVHDWQLKPHAKGDFYRWLASWAVACRMPSDLGFDDNGFVLPPLYTHQVTVECDTPAEGQLFATEAQGLAEVRKAQRASLLDRVAKVAELVNADQEPWLVWCWLNDESAALKRAIPDAVEVRGSDSAEHKERALLDFAEGRIRVLVSKPSIAGWGMNFQHCARIAFVGQSYSWESWYQAIRRCWRFGQKRAVNCTIVVGEQEGAVVQAIHEKEKQAEGMMNDLVEHMQGLQMDAQGREEAEYLSDEARGSDWTLYLGDCVERVNEIAAESVALVVTSVPFPTMYTYSNQARDMGNVRDIEEMIEHFRHLIGAEKLLRVMMPGRVCAIHLQQAMAFKWLDGHSGIRDFRGKTIDAMVDAGWLFTGEVTIEKNPQAKAARTKDRGLLFKTLATDSSLCVPCMADYLLLFRAPGENPRPVRAGRNPKYGNHEGWITNDEWIEWASPVWRRYTPDYPGGIKETDVLNVAVARDKDDQRHLCPLQLGVIERAVKLWTAPGELVCDPFAGIGSTGYRALQLGRRFVGIELKESYWRTAVKNLREAAAKATQPNLFSLLEEDDGV